MLYDKTDGVICNLICLCHTWLVEQWREKKNLLLLSFFGYFLANRVTVGEVRIECRFKFKMAHAHLIIVPFLTQQDW